MERSDPDLWVAYKRIVVVAVSFTAVDILMEVL